MQNWYDLSSNTGDEAANMTVIHSDLLIFYSL